MKTLKILTTVLRMLLRSRLLRSLYLSHVNALIAVGHIASLLSTSQKQLGPAIDI